MADFADYSEFLTRLRNIPDGGDRDVDLMIARYIGIIPHDGDGFVPEFTQRVDVALQLLPEHCTLTFDRYYAGMTAGPSELLWGADMTIPRLPQQAALHYHAHNHRNLACAIVALYYDKEIEDSDED